MSDNLDLSMRLTMTGADQAAADVAKVREAIAAIAEPARRAQAQVRRMAEAFEAVTTSARKASDAATATVERMNTAIATEARQLRAELAGTFSPLGTSAKENATAATTAMSGLSTETTSAIERIRTAAATAFEPIASSMTTAAETVKAGFVSINEAMATTIAQARAAAVEIAKINTPTPSTAPASKNAGLRNAAGRGYGGPHFRAEGVRVPGGHVSLGGTPAMAAAAVGGYAVYEAMQAQDQALRLALTSQVDPALLGVSADEYQRLIMSGAAETGDSVENVADAYSRATRGMQGVDPAKRLDLIRKLLPTARAESKLKGAPLGETLQSFIELGHQTGEYDPDRLKALSSKLSIASLSTNSSLPEFGKTLSYSLPVLHAEGLDPDTIISMTAAMQNAGVNSTKSGTWIRSFYQGLLPKFGAKGDDKHNSALARLGLGSPAAWQVRDRDGNVDWKASTDRSVDVMREKTAGMSESERNTTLHDAFGERGSSVAALMLQRTVQDQFDGIHKRISGGGDVDLFTQYSEHRSLQQAQQTWRDTQNLLIDIGQTALPAVNTGLRDLDNIVKSIADAFNGKGWGNLGKLLWDKGIKPDLGPLGRLNTAPDDGADRPPPADMTDPRRRDDLRQNNAFVDDGVDRGASGGKAPRMGWDAAMQIWAQTALDIRDARNAITGPAMAAWQAAKADLDAIKDGIQLIGEGIAAFLKQNGISGSGGVQNASYETGGGTGSGLSGSGSSGASGGYSVPAIGKGVGHLYNAAVREAFIRHEAAIRHIDPEVAMAVARSEGFNRYVGDYGSSFGDFQMHTASNRPGMRSRGLGDLYREKTGKNPADPRNGFDLDRFALDQVAKDGWGAWHGAARIGIHGRHGLNYQGPVPAAPDAADMVAKGLTRPLEGRKGKAAAPTIHVHGVHDPEQAANAVMRKLNAARDVHTIDTDFIS